MEESYQKKNDKIFNFQEHISQSVLPLTAKTLLDSCSLFYLQLPVTFIAGSFQTAVNNEIWDE